MICVANRRKIFTFTTGIFNFIYLYISIIGVFGLVVFWSMCFKEDFVLFNFQVIDDENDVSAKLVNNLIKKVSYLKLTEWSSVRDIAGRHHKKAMHGQSCERVMTVNLQIELFSYS